MCDDWLEYDELDGDEVLQAELAADEAEDRPKLF